MFLIAFCVFEFAFVKTEKEREREEEWKRGG